MARREINYEVTRVEPLVHMLPGIGAIDYVFDRAARKLVANLNGQEVLALEGDEAEQMRVEVNGLDRNPDTDEEMVSGMVEKAWGLDFESLFVRTRKREVLEYRQIVMWWLAENTRRSYAWIGQLMGGFDRNTVVHAKNLINNLFKTDRDIRAKVAQFVNSGNLTSPNPPPVDGGELSPPLGE